MCGLVGAVGKIDYQIEKMFKLMLQLDTVRGPHSTGILSVTREDNASILKKVGSPFELEQYKAYDRLFSRCNAVLLGHNRWATKGEVNNINAHPFHCGSIYGAHNGTLTITSNLVGHTEFEVDSENIFHNIDVEGVETTIEKLKGAFALTWYDSKTRTLNLTRNNERPLYYAYTEDKCTVLWASEMWMLKVAADKIGVKIGECFDVAVGNLYTFEVPSVIPSQVKPYTGAIIKKLKLKTAEIKSNLVPFKGGLHAMVGKSVNFFPIDIKTTQWKQNYIECELDSDGKDSVEVRVYTEVGSKLYEDMKDSLDMFKGTVTRYACYQNESHLVVSPSSIEKIFESTVEDSEIFLVNNELKTLSEMNEILSNGCAWCSGTSSIEDYEELEFLDDGSYLCPHCQSSNFVQSLIGGLK